MKTHFLSGDINWPQYGGKFITKKLNNGDWDYWLVIDFINMDEACGEDTGAKYVAQVCAVSPQAAGWRNIKAALRCGCLRLKDFKREYRQHIVLQALSDYGVFATVDSFSGNNYKTIMRQARKALDCIAGLFGFFMDGPKNRLGHTGWDFITGDLSIDKVVGKAEFSPNFHVVS